MGLYTDADNMQFDNLYIYDAKARDPLTPRTGGLAAGSLSTGLVVEADPVTGQVKSGHWWAGQNRPVNSFVLIRQLTCSLQAATFAVPLPAGRSAAFPLSR
jgi:hypothetical protein